MAAPKKDLKEDFQRLISRLENMILTGVFQPRERLIELNLAKELDVSRFWIRDAIKILETRGLIKVMPYKGAMVCDLDEQEIEDIFEVRQQLETLATRKAAANTRKSDVRFLKRLESQFENSIRRGNFTEMISINESFHDYIYDLSWNDVLIQMIRQLKARCHILRYHAWSSPDTIQIIQEEHRQFIEGMETKNANLLDDLARKHISYSKDSYLMHRKSRIATQTVD
jgi:DNA-binding GntR family transcriptional regulator